MKTTMTFLIPQEGIREFPAVCIANFILMSIFKSRIPVQFCLPIQLVVEMTNRPVMVFGLKHYDTQLQILLFPGARLTGWFSHFMDR